MDGLVPINLLLSVHNKSLSYTLAIVSFKFPSIKTLEVSTRKDLKRMAAIYSLYIINKSGGLIFYKDYGSAGRMDTNDSLRVASLWHSMHAISQQLSPISGCSGTELLEADTFDLHCFQSLTGTKFFVVCEPGTLHMEGLLKYIYELYTDYVLKNPFYEMEMPIRCELFDINLVQAVQKDRVALLGR
ncbi:Trafficking protein particle complex subunit 4, partial [Cucurbita argyrosperma subsp. sororia]